MNGQPKKLVDALEAAKETLRALEEALERTKKMIDQTRKLIDDTKADHEPPSDDATPAWALLRFARKLRAAVPDGGEDHLVGMGRSSVVR
jgi:hypothetical protein